MQFFPRPLSHFTPVLPNFIFDCERRIRRSCMSLGVFSDALRRGSDLGTYFVPLELEDSCIIGMFECHPVKASLTCCVEEYESLSPSKKEP
jgi:hypothetical protein